MQLTYRGQSYTASPTVAPVATSITISYRGQSYQLRRSPDPLVKPQANLVYRGVPYVTDSTPAVGNLTPAFS